LSHAEAKFDEACRAIEFGEWDNAYETLSRISQNGLPSELTDAIRTMSDILDPANSPDEKAAKIVQFLPGMIFHVYDDEHGWNDDAMRELADVQRDASELAREPRFAMGTGPSKKA
jgi:hypothetical protein